ncbi:MAG: YcxB family protein [Clostridia bacterium]|nr:YcxB family protein [Clostridia bacterium]
MEKITVKSTLDGKDYEKVTMFGAFTKSVLLPLVLCFSIPLSLLQIMEVINTGVIHNKFAYYGSVFLLSLIIFMYFMVRLSIKSFIKNDKVLLGKTRKFIIDEKSITTVSSDHVKNNYAYNQFIDAYEINGYFLLYMDKVSGLVITKRDMEASEIETVRTVFKNAFGKKFHVRGKK